MSPAGGWGEDPVLSAHCLGGPLPRRPSVVKASSRPFPVRHPAPVLLTKKRDDLPHHESVAGSVSDPGSGWRVRNPWGEPGLGMQGASLCAGRAVERGPGSRSPSSCPRLSRFLDADSTGVQAALGRAPHRPQTPRAAELRGNPASPPGPLKTALRSPQSVSYSKSHVSHESQAPSGIYGT